jgi:hypothetical protein
MSNKIIKYSIDLSLIIVENVKHLDKEYQVHNGVVGNSKGFYWWVFDIQSRGIQNLQRKGRFINLSLMF